MRYLCLIFALVFCLAFADENTHDILNPPALDLQVWCDMAHESITKGEDIDVLIAMNTATYALPETGSDFGYDGVQLETPSAMISRFCAADARRLSPLPKVERITAEHGDIPSRLTLGGSVKNLEEAETWVAALVAFDYYGNELGRLLPYDESVGEEGVWERDCSAECFYEGFNFYFFRVTGEFANAVYAATTVKILVNRGDGIENVVFDYKAIDALKPFRR